MNASYQVDVVVKIPDRENDGAECFLGYIVRAYSR